MNLVNPFAFGGLWWMAYCFAVAIRVAIEVKKGGEA